MIACSFYWRSEGDSNPRTGFADYTLSRRASSTTRASLQRGFSKTSANIIIFFLFTPFFLRFLQEFFSIQISRHSRSDFFCSLSLIGIQRSSNPSGIFISIFFAFSSTETTKSSVAGINNSSPFSRSTTNRTLVVDISTSTICPKYPLSVS